MGPTIVRTWWTIRRRTDGKRSKADDAPYRRRSASPNPPLNTSECDGWERNLSTVSPHQRSHCQGFKLRCVLPTPAVAFRAKIDFKPALSANDIIPSTGAALNAPEQILGAFHEALPPMARNHPKTRGPLCDEGTTFILKVTEELGVFFG
ncbi:hypothetical protein PSHT_06714 [Puccinia striiformis]|uniref:Uncharacterized protein n=1 Tax=Puccinia striiformis TaxID=27350 RepID=A0A2S4W4T6_9BASI|nr:hypothetical protein PSHT_06714 [Puccinia striiformis]